MMFLQFFGVLLVLATGVVGVDDELPPAGLYVRLNQKAVDYISELASDAFPEIFNNLSPPKFKAGPAKISEIHISNVSRPSIQAKFLNKKGVRAHIKLPSIRASAFAEVNVFVFSYDGGFMADLSDLSILLELHFKHNGSTTVEAPICNVTHSDLALTFPPSSSLASLREEFENAVISALTNAVCSTAVEALNFVLAQRPIPTDEDPDFEIAVDEDAFSAAELGSSLCKVEEADDVAMGQKAAAEVTSKLENSTRPGVWAVDLNLNYPPTFTDDDVVFGVDGGIIYNGWKADAAQAPPILNKTLLDKRMIGVLMSDYIPNTLFTHIFYNDLGSFRERFTPTHMPKFLQKLSKALCSKCYLEVNANLTDQPRVEINADMGARMQLAVNLSARFHGRDELHEVIHANARLHVTLKPTIRHSRVLGDVSLTNVDVNVFDLGLSGPLATPIEKLFSFVVPRILWPQVKKRLRFAMNRRGVKLPVMCGVEFEHMTLDYTNRAVVLNTDFTFDLPLFIEKFKQYLTFKAQRNPSLPRYVIM